MNREELQSFQDKWADKYKDYAKNISRTDGQLGFIEWLCLQLENSVTKPKYKVGDIVKSCDGDVYKIAWIVYSKEGWVYWNDGLTVWGAKHVYVDTFAYVEENLTYEEE